MLKRILLALGLVVSTPVRADTIVIDRFDPGGTISTYYQWYERWNASGAKLVIDAPCASACTLFLAFTKDNDERVCITTRGSLGFHQASEDGSAKPLLTQVLIRAWYPEWVQKIIADRGGVEPDAFFVYPEEMAGHIRLCDGSVLPSVPVDRLVKTTPTGFVTTK